MGLKKLTVVKDTVLFVLIRCFGSFLLRSCIVPLLGDLLLPVLVLLDLADSLFDDAEDLSDLEVLHVLVVVEFVRKFKQLVDFCFFLFFKLLLGLGPGWL